MKKLLFSTLIMLCFSANASNTQLEESSSNQWQSSIIEDNGQRYYRSLIMSQNKQSLFAVDLSAQDCKTHLFKTFLMKEPETRFDYSTGTFLNFIRSDSDNENTFFALSDVVGKEAETLAISTHKLHGVNDNLNHFFSVMERSNTMNFYFTTPYGNSYNYKFDLKNAVGVLINNLQQCQQNLKGDDDE